MMPAPSGRRSSARNGGGLKISKQRKSIRLSRRYFQVSGARISGNICPATSSITTKPGSLMPLSRTTRVLAGIPIAGPAIAVTAATTERCSALRASAHHSNTVTVDAHVPGPGRTRPMPKNVPIAQAQRERGSGVSDALLAAALIFSAGILCSTWFNFLEQLGIHHRRADAIGAASPLSQIDQPASITAKREVLRIAQDDSLARRTSQAEDLLSSHNYKDGWSRPFRPASNCLAL